MLQCTCTSTINPSLLPLGESTLYVVTLTGMQRHDNSLHVYTSSCTPLLFVAHLPMFSQVLDKLDFSSNETHDRLQGLFAKMKWQPYHGVLFQLFKGLTHPSATEQTHGLLARILPYSNKPLFDQSQGAGLPLNVLTLLPLLFNHFDEPTDFCKVVVSNIQQVRELLCITSLCVVCNVIMC